MKATILSCVLSTLTVLAVSTPNLRSAVPPLNVTSGNGDFKLKFSVQAFPGVKFGESKFVYNGPGGMSGSGCGADNQKCSCTDFVGGFLMIGEGTDGTATGLTFACAFSVDGNPCTLYIDIPYVEHNTLTWECPGYTMIGGQVAPTGHVFDQSMMVEKNG